MTSRTLGCARQNDYARPKQRTAIRARNGVPYTALLILLISLNPCTCLSQNLFGSPPLGPALGLPVLPSLSSSQDMALAVQFKRMFNSFTSYEFADPDPPMPNPISRLEFPLDQWWGGVVCSYATRLFALTCEVTANLSGPSDPKFQDSDWLLQGEPLYILYPLMWVEDWGPADQKNIFSQSRCRLNRGYSVDAAMDLRGAAVAFGRQAVECCPIVGVRCQGLEFTTYDGVQRYFPSSQELIFLGERTGTFVDLLPVDLPGDGIGFTQLYDQYYLGGKVLVNLNPSDPWFGNGRFRFMAQADLGYVKGRNEDRHLLRGERITIEETQGLVWHLGLNLSYLVTGTLNLRGEFDFKRISTAGSHYWNEAAPGPPPQTWQRGVRVWSDQAFLATLAELLF